MFAASKTAAAAAGAPPPPSGNDPQFNYVTMLLHGDGTNGAQNNTFVDSSTNNFTITRNGTPTQGSFSPYGDLWSNFFNGTNAVLNTTETAAFDMGSGNFTAEFWAYPTATQTGGIVRNANSGSFAGFAVSWESSRFKMLCSYSGSSWAVDVLSSSTYSLNTWHHVAMVRNGSTVTLYVNGTSAATGNVSTNSLLGGQALYVGFSRFSSEYFTGYLSNLRIVKGTAVYTSNFTPSTTPLTAVSGTSLLTCQSNRFRDNSSNNFAITVTGTPSVQRFSPFDPAAEYSTSVIGGSGIFTATSQFLTAPASSTAWSWGTSSYTIELWVYPTDLAVNRALIAKQQSTSNDWELYLTSAGGVNFRYWNGSQQLVSTSGSLVAANRWTHIAFVNNAGAITIYVNGVSSATGTVQSGWSNGNLTLKIGQAQFGTSPSDYLGYMSNVRLVNGTAVYTAAFTPPTAPLTAITNTSLLLNTVNAGIFDNAMMNDLVTVGNAQVSTAVKKYGTGSMAFDGNGDLLSMPYGPTFSLKGTYTVEAWIYPATVSGWRPVFTIQPTVTANFGNFGLVCNGSVLTFELRPTNGGGITSISGGTVTTNTWQHIALSVNGNSGRLFLNGTQVGSTTTLPTWTFTPVGVGVGANINGFSNTTEVFNGYIDDVRVTNGVARYTANFTPPTAAFPNN